MPRDDMLEDPLETDRARQPILALVHGKFLTALYHLNPAEAAACAAAQRALNDSVHRHIYEIDPCLPYPPPVGSVVDPELLGWVLLV